MRSEQDIRHNAALEKSAETTDRFFAGRALRLAWLAAGQTDPNPLVGAVVVNDGVIVGEGFHERSGDAHAEVTALDAAGPLSCGGTLYVTLEPCSHQGKTPPCVDRIIESGVRRVVTCTLDPDERVSGQGIRRLRENNIQVDVGLLREQAFLLNLAYFKRQLSLGSTVVLKAAMTLDGKIASGPGMRDTITGKSAHEYVHRLRAESDAVVVGIDTLLTDRPQLDCRHLPGASAPVAVVLDSRLQFPVDYPWLDEGRRFVVCCAQDVDDAQAQPFEHSSGRVVRCKSADSMVDIDDAIAKLAGNGWANLLVEGGGHVITGFIEQDRWDAMNIFVSSKFFGEDGVPLYRSGMGCENAGAVAVDAQRIGNDFLLRYINRATMELLSGRLKSE